MCNKGSRVWRGEENVEEEDERRWSASARERVAKNDEKAPAGI